MADQDLLEMPVRGLGAGTGARHRVVVMGAGVAGLVAAFELDRAGHDVVVLEAQNRVGGRIYTLRGFAPGLYAEAGAMRLPVGHRLTMAYVERFGLETRPFMMDNPHGLVHVAGKRMTAREADACCDELPYDRAPHELGRTATQLWEEALADLRGVLTRDGAAGWQRIVAENDQYSLYDFLQVRGWSEGAIEMLGVLNFLESDLYNAAVEVLREELGGFYSDMVEIVGGMDLLPRALYEPIADRVQFGAEVHALEQDDDGVTVHYRTRAGRFSVTADYAVCAIPFSVLRHVEVLTPFSRAKQKAIRQLNYAASTKVLFQVRHRFWEDSDGIFGGATCTDLPVRRLNYPTPDPATPRGVLLASYTWSQDALRWGSMDEHTRIEQALEDVALIHPEIREHFEVGASHAWYGDRWAGGAFALFEPEQQTRLHDAITAPEGRIRFAGEHCSLYHAWIQGALESGILAARDIHTSRGDSRPAPSLDVGLRA